MIQVALEVRTGAARFRIRARARSIQRAVNLVGTRYPGGEVRMILPIDPESFFVEDASNKEEFTGLWMPETVAG
jgi:hypothetical protein